MGILSRKTSNKKEEVKTAQVKGIAQYTINVGFVECPHCDHRQSVDSYLKKAETIICTGCNKQFNIEWE